ncbi:MAG: glucans biosynthesis glucosyltransferase MdoH [Phenylobacterium sp.]|uniref:glucans biosynthesis glucosyltransferase MdoH n=1 Tax=Phenylobacterium sp. TaxID=1871053 RepID=UPI0025D91F2F|nr:glucans biosynthesis glucosyltransferase MdoH [Phenylobacterium sp.]MCA6298796.1 glucans biosynthesis glucosyltransferase MdoH [Phenylobacterium sp.]
MDGLRSRQFGASTDDAWTREAPVRAWLPAEAPLDMPRHGLAEDGTPPPVPGPQGLALRRSVMLVATLVLSLLAFLTPARVYAEDGFTALEIIALCLFSALIVPLSGWFCNAFAGLVLQVVRGDRDHFEFPERPGRPQVRTALLMPLYNEDAGAAFARLARIDQGLRDLDAAGAFDLFVLSDSTCPEAAEAEWAAFQGFRLSAACRTYYRRRETNTERKAGNVADWVRRFGGAYPHMVILDADSLMSGETLLHLVDAMERHPRAGLIQTAPAIINAETLYQRVQQFGVRLYGRVAATGLAWWTGPESAYFGHNAIVRVRAFAESCGLPVLPGRKPLGGHVMSHDSVEAAYLRRQGWSVHMTGALPGSYEEAPPGLQAFLARDRRWCQGNMQHLRLLTAAGLHPMSRLQMLIGVMAYLASPLWFLALLTGLIIQFQTEPRLLEISTVHGWRTIVEPRQDGLVVIWMAALSWFLLFGPKLFGSLLALCRRRDREAFGGVGFILPGVALEVIMSVVMAPIMMVSHTRMLIEIFSGRDSGWRPQQREAGRMTWSEAFAAHAWEVRAGVVFAAALLARPDLTLVFLPIVLPLLASPAISLLGSRVEVGTLARRYGFLLTPEELELAPRSARERRPPPAAPAPANLAGALPEAA